MALENNLTVSYKTYTYCMSPFLGMYPCEKTTFTQKSIQKCLIAPLFVIAKNRKQINWRMDKQAVVPPHNWNGILSCRTPTAARKPWEPWGGEEGSCRVRSKGGFPSSPLTPQPVARPPAASQGHTPAGRAIQGISSPPGTPPSRASLFLCSPNSPESGASSIGIARSQEQGENEAPGPQGGLGTGVLAGWRRG